MSDKIKIVIATPLKDARTLNQPHPFFQKTAEQIAQIQDSPYEFYFATMEGGICHARNKMVQAAKKLGAQQIVWWDYDIEATVDDMMKLVTNKLPIVGALYTTREDRGHWVANFMHEVELQEGGMLQVIESGCGLKKYHMEVFYILDKVYEGIAYTDRDTGERLHGYFQQIVMQTDLKPDGDWITEDFFLDHLCRHSRTKGMGIFVDTTIKVKHRGPDGTLYPTGDWPPVPIDEKVTGIA